MKNTAITKGQIFTDNSDKVINAKVLTDVFMSNGVETVKVNKFSKYGDHGVFLIAADYLKKHYTKN